MQSRERPEEALRPVDAVHAPRGGRRPWLRLGLLGPLVLVIWLLADIGLRLLPPEWFRTHPMTIIELRPRRHSSFTPNLDMVVPYWEGDGAQEANLPATEQRAPMRISTDSLGFRRNPYADPAEPVDVLFLLGRSFLIGAALSDEETLPAVFTRISGLTAYNGARAREDPVDNPTDLDWLLQRLPGSPRVAVLIILEEDTPVLPKQAPKDVAGADAGLQSPSGSGGSMRRLAAEARRHLKIWYLYSPLTALTSRLFRSLADGRLFPNEGLRGGRQLRLPDGRLMLFRRYEVSTAQQGRTTANAERIADYVEWWQQQLTRRGMETWVLLMPSRYTIYGPWLDDAAERDRIEQLEKYLLEVNRQLRERGVSTVNALPLYRSSVEEQLATGQLLFYREDNHWNLQGVELIARALADSIRSSPVIQDQVKAARTANLTK
jgi:hypothetical protein